MEHIKKRLKEFFKEFSRTIKLILNTIVLVVLPICEFLYRTRDLFVISIISIACLSCCKGIYSPNEFMVLIMFLAWICLLLRVVHRKYKAEQYSKLKKQRKRFTSLNKEGHPQIYTEDLPEIIEFLYRLEEGEI